MKNALLSCLLLLVFGIASCHKTTEAEPELDPKDNPLKEHTLDLQEAKLWFPGKWKLVKAYTMLPYPTLPKVELVIDDAQISLLEDGTQIDKVDYEIVKLEYHAGYYLKINTNAQRRENNDYVQNPSLYINKNRMYFDLGRAQDGAAYEFKKL